MKDKSILCSTRKKKYEAKRNAREFEQVIKPEITSEYRVVLVRKCATKKQGILLHIQELS